MIRCPAGCEIRDHMGTCEACTRDTPRPERLILKPWMIWVCAAALEAWKDAGYPGPTLEQQRELHGRLVPPPILPRAPAKLDPALEGAPESLRDWQIYTEGTEAEAQRRVRAIAHSYDMQWRQVRGGGAVRNLILLGHNGTGKTLLMRILGRRAALAGCSVRFVVFTELVKRVKLTRDPRSPDSEDQVLKPYLDADLLLLDDIRPVFASQDDENITNRVLHHRHGEDQGLPNRPTFVTSQLSMTELQGVIGSSAMSRLLQRNAVKPLACAWRPYQAWMREPGED